MGGCVTVSHKSVPVNHTVEWTARLFWLVPHSRGERLLNYLWKILVPRVWGALIIEPAGCTSLRDFVFSVYIVNYSRHRREISLHWRTKEQNWIIYFSSLCCRIYISSCGWPTNFCRRQFSLWLPSVEKVFCCLERFRFFLKAEIKKTVLFYKITISRDYPNCQIAKNLTIRRVECFFSDFSLWNLWKYEIWKYNFEEFLNCDIMM